jgi:hypothetical protein
MESMDLVDEPIKAIEIPKEEKASGVRPEVQKWKRPEHNWMKLNCDGALDFNSKAAGAGMVARDCTGAFVLAECRRYENIIDPGTAEILACRDAILLARSRGWSHIVVETDCQLIVKAWHKEKL